MDSRRFRNAIIIGLLTWGLFGAGLGFVSAVGEETPDAFFVGEKKIGDELVYEVKIGEGNYTVMFTWIAPELRVNATGFSSMHNVLRLRVEGKDDPGAFWEEEHHRHFFYVPGEAAPQNSRTFYATNGEAGTPVTQSRLDITIERDSFFPPRPPCGVFDVPATISRGDIVSTIPCEALRNEVGNLSPVGLEDGLLKLEGTTTFHRLNEEGPMYAWFGEGIPYPMKFEAITEKLDAAGNKVAEKVTLHLKGFKPGEALLLTTPSSGERVHEELEGPRYPWGPDEGTRAGFTLRAAYQYLLENGNITGGDVIAASHSTEEKREGDLWETWTLTIADRVFSVSTVETEGLLGLFPESSIHVADHPHYEEIPISLPKTMPTADTLLSRVDTYTSGNEKVGIGWGFRISCFAGNCDDVRTSTWGGSSHKWWWEVNPFAGTTVIETTTATVIALGSLSTWDSDATQYENLGIASAAPPPEPTSEPTFSVSPWIAPTAEAAAGLGILGLLAGALYYFKPAFFGLFSRVQKDQVLEHPTRANLLETIQENPGLHLQGLMRQTHLAGGTLRHHLAVLGENDYVKRIDAGGRSCYFPRGAMNHGEMVALAAMSPKGREIFALLDSPRTVTQVATMLGMGRSTVSHHVAKLVQSGAITATKQGRKTILRKGTGLSQGA